MADKKITDLQLISSVTADISIPGDNGIQTYRVTTQQLFDWILASQNILLPMLKQDIFTGLTAVTAADDDYFPFVDTSDSNKTKKGLVGSFRNSAVRSVTSTDTAASSDEILVLSGASFTQTLPANGTVGKKLRLIHRGTSLSQKYTLATQGGATIGGIASGSYVLCTNGEALELVDDGTNYQILSHSTGTAKTTYTMTVGATTTPPTLNGSVTKVTSWSRTGQFMDLDVLIDQASSSGAAAGSGVYKFPLPSGAAINTTLAPVPSTAPSASVNIGRGGYSAGNGYARTTASGDANYASYLESIVYDSTNLYAVSIAGATLIHEAALASANVINLGDVTNIAFKARIPISDWQP